jgi:glutamate-1-semialdehyde aminotransferase
MRSYARSIALYDRTRKSLAGGVSSNVRYASTPVPLFFARGEGARLYDVDGNAHIDYVLGNGPAILGHAPKPVIDAVAASLARDRSMPRSMRVKRSSPSACAGCYRESKWCVLRHRAPKRC